MIDLPEKTTATATPFIKWVGGKQKLMPQIRPHLPEPGSFRYYLEPFLGGGAMFFEVGHTATEVMLSDQNGELIRLYQTVRDNPERLTWHLKHLEEEYFSRRSEEERKDLYLSVRAEDGDLASTWEAAARTIFLNKTGFNGLYRVNSKGVFNVPHGRTSGPTPPKICNSDAILAASLALQGVTIRRRSFIEPINLSGPDPLSWADAFVYLDPPYHPTTTTSKFTGYQAGGFSEENQAQVAKLFREIDAGGGRVMASNSDTPLTRELYQGFRVESIERSGSVSCKAGGRGRVGEILIANY